MMLPTLLPLKHVYYYLVVQQPLTLMRVICPSVLRGLPDAHFCASTCLNFEPGRNLPPRRFDEAKHVLLRGSAMLDLVGRKCPTEEQRASLRLAQKSTVNETKHV
jgi:hypothetical protein